MERFKLILSLLIVTVFISYIKTAKDKQDKQQVTIFTGWRSEARTFQDCMSNFDPNR